MRRYRAKDDILFSKARFSDASQATIEKARNEIRGMPPSLFSGGVTDRLVADTIQKYDCVVPTLNRDSIEVDQRETDIEVGGRDFGYVDGPRTIRGVAIDVYVPFTGDGELFVLRPSTYDFNPPYGSVDGTTFVFTVSGRTLTTEEVQRAIDERLGTVEKYLANLAIDVTAHSEQLKRVVPDELHARAQKVQANTSLVSGLGYKVRGKEE